MRGGSLTRYTPMSQDGSGLFSRFVGPVLERGGQAVARKVQKHVKRALKRKADQVLDRVSKRVKRSVHDILGP